MLVMRKKKKEPPIGASELAALAEQERAVAEQIAKMEEMISSAPDRIRREYEESRSLMPPPDDWEDRQRAKRFNAHLSKGEIRNEHRYQARSTFLFVLLVIAIFSVAGWILSFIKTLA
ncbi:hypothetical protein AAFN60_19425 [Roseibacillus persicicus]|uniref:Uncharacterized protein n=2 Tax=Roseibacillus persicicus TaxID=454148 RepID=A0A918WKW7_9BACT|nr:hypothetical protein GCM10007100_23140 [Roseibacillus persicicus]